MDKVNKYGEHLFDKLIYVRTKSDEKTKEELNKVIRKIAEETEKKST